MSQTPADLRYTKSHEWLRTLPDGTHRDRHHRPRAAVARRPRVRRGARGGPPARRGRRLRRRRVGEGGLRRLQSGRRRGDGGKSAARHRAGTHQPRSLWRGLDHARQAGGRRRHGNAGCRGLRGQPPPEAECPTSRTRPRTSARCSTASAPAASTTCSTRFPTALRIDALPGVPEALPEMDVARLAGARAAGDGLPLNFIGAGAYEHHIPAPVWALVTRGEIYSAYTPYQAEASQGTLQIMYEYQSMIAGLTAHGRVERLALRRRLRARRGLPHGGARAPALEVGAHPGAGDGQPDLAPRRRGDHRGPGPEARGRAVRSRHRLHRCEGARAVRRRGHHRDRHPAAELLRAAGGRRCADALGARERRARHRGRESGGARAASRRRASGATAGPTSPWATPSPSACRCPPAVPTSGSWPAAWSTCARCPGASRAAPWTSRASPASR